MADDTNLNAAYETVYEGEKNMLVSVKALLDKFNTDLTAAIGDQPTTAPTTAARQFVQRVQSALMGLSSYDISNVLAQYGVQSASGMPVVAAGTSSGTGV